MRWLLSVSILPVCADLADPLTYLSSHYYWYRRWCGRGRHQQQQGKGVIFLFHYIPFLHVRPFPGIDAAPHLPVCLCPLVIPPLRISFLV